jgi:hypothetical protein
MKALKILCMGMFTPVQEGVSWQDCVNIDKTTKEKYV